MEPRRTGGFAGATRARGPHHPRVEGPHARTTPTTVAPTALPVNDKATRVQAMFARIAPRYDLMNALMTGGRDRAWRRAAARLAAPPARSLALDLATGTGDLALALLRETKVRRHLEGPDFEIGARLVPASEHLIGRVIHVGIVVHRNP